ncbi:MAG: SGNH/GDSL hydrolase family protein [Candidatus Heimdallarchaeota archaeon]
MIYRVLCIGDSHTAGFPLFDPVFGGNPRSSYQYWLQKNCQAVVPDLCLVLSNRGVCGQTSHEIVTRLRRELDRSQVEYNSIIFWAGANDIALGYGSVEIFENIKKGVRISQEFRLKILVLTLPPMPLGWGDVVRQVNTMLTTNSGELYYVVDTYSVLEENGNLSPHYDCGDGIHLSVMGYRVVGRLLCEAIQCFLGVPQE